MKKITLYGLVLLVVLLGGYMVYEKFYTGVAEAPVLPTPSNSTSASKETLNPNTGTTQVTQTGKTGYKNGQYTGQVADAFYGLVQVKAIISGGKITDVQFLQYPNGSGHSQEISNFSIPQLTQEAIQAQSSKVDVVSGATQTSEAFIQSLSSALSQAS